MSALAKRTMITLNVTGVFGFTYKCSRAGVPVNVPGSRVTKLLRSSDLISRGWWHPHTAMAFPLYTEWIWAHLSSMEAM